MKRLAITIGGAVSLGSFEAGAIYEILAALKQHNQTAAPDDKIIVDVLTGASAGGMTAAIAAQKLLFDGDSLDGASANAFYAPWVREVGLVQLLSLGADESPGLSVLSSDLIESTVRRHLTAGYATGSPPPGTLHPAASPQIKLGLAMSNLSGIDYSIPILTGGDFVYTKFQDQFIVELDSTIATHNSAPTWEGICNAAVGCGAFPFAFRIKEVMRDSKAYPGATNLPPTLGRYAYTDGGTFQNEPLGMAKNLVDRFDPQHAENDSRHYLFIAPNLRGSVMDQGNFVSSDATFAKTAKRLITAIFNQARYHDWVRIETINGKVQRFDDESLKLLGLMKAGTVTAASLQPAGAALLPVAYPDGAARDDAITRLRKQFDSDLRAAALSAGDATEWLNAIAVLEKILGVECYDQMRVYAVSATDKELAGSCLMYFGGFFDQRYREHDYQMGRLKAQEMIAGLAGAVPGSTLGPINYAPEAVAIDDTLTDVEPANLSSALRKQLKGQIVDRAHRAMQEMGMGFATRQIVADTFIVPKVNEFLGL